jgi:hypothetical protein
MNAELITRFKNFTSDGAILEWVVWRLPKPLAPSEHGYKYRGLRMSSMVCAWSVLTMNWAKAITPIWTGSSAPMSFAA